jgi:hypothetical protein
MSDEVGAELPPQKARFFWLRIAKLVLIFVLIAALCGGLWFGVNSRNAKIAWASLILNNHEHYLPCEQLPFFPEVQKSLLKHQDIVNEIKQLGGYDVSASEIKCPSVDGKLYFIKGDILIQYHSRNQRMAIEKLIGDNFFGIPYRGENH